MRRQLIKAKATLYNTLLKRPNFKITEKEVDILVLLTEDPDIQNLLEEQRKKE